ncbi:MAG: hypothetical protein JWL83_2819 [Actinomycetia bacterium]|nr:hypothetical protein [Actinomycetes bacterium]
MPMAIHVWRRVSTAQRLMISAPFGVVVGAVVALFTTWLVGALVAWDVMAVVLVTWFWLAVRGLSPNQTAQVATMEDESRVTVELLQLSASVASLVGTGAVFVEASHEHGLAKAALTALGVLTVVASWTLVHSVYAIRYAHLYYTPPIGDIDFKTDEKPDYQDFAYVAFTVGMTYQVSDTDIRGRAMRRAVLRHALLAYLFGAVILASMVNIVAGLAQ